MTIRILKPQKINGVQYAADTVIIGLDKDIEARAIEGGGAELTQSPAALSPKPRRRIFLHDNLSTSASSAGKTWQAMCSCKVPFYGVQFTFANSSATDFTQAGNRITMSAAATEKSTDRTGPWQGGVLTTNWTPLTFNNGTLSYPPLLPGSQYAYTYATSDVVAVNSLAPTEGTQYKVLLRQYHQVNGLQFVNGNSDAQIQTVAGKINCELKYDLVGVGDYTATNPGALTTPDTGAMSCIGFTFHTQGAVAQILVAGDSIVGGLYASANVYSYIQAGVAALSTTYGKDVSVSCSAIGGSSSAAYFANVKALVAAGLSGKIFSFPMHTRNDPGGNTPTPAQTQQRIAMARLMAQWAVDNGMIPVIVGPSPENALAGAGRINLAALEAAGPGLAAEYGGVYVSALTALGSGAGNNYAFAVAGDQYDGVHYLDQGADKVGAAWAAKVAPLV